MQQDDPGVRKGESDSGCAWRKTSRVETDRVIFLRIIVFYVFIREANQNKCIFHLTHGRLL